MGNPVQKVLGAVDDSVLSKPDLSASTAADARSVALAQDLDQQRQNQQPLNAPQIGDPSSAPPPPAYRPPPGGGAVPPAAQAWLAANPPSATGYNARTGGPALGSWAAPGTAPPGSAASTLPTANSAPGGSANTTGAYGAPPVPIASNSTIGSTPSLARPGLTSLAPNAAPGGPAPIATTGPISSMGDWRGPGVASNQQPAVTTPGTAAYAHSQASLAAEAAKSGANISASGAPGTTNPYSNSMPAPAPASYGTTQTSDLSRQGGALDLLTSQANGTAPSAAAIQTQQNLGTSMANQFALASATQGRHPGAAFQAAASGAATAQAADTASGAALRAQEQATAQNNLATQVGGARGQDVQTDVANLNAKLTTMGYDEQTKNALLSAQLQAQGYDVATANGIVAANVAAAASKNALNGSLFSAGGSALGL